MQSYLTNDGTVIGRRIAADSVAPPTIGQVAEEFRQTLKNKFGAYPPNLNTSINPDNSIQITAGNPENGMSLQITILDLNANKQPPGPTITPPTPVAPPPAALPATTLPAPAAPTQ